MEREIGLSDAEARLVLDTLEMAEKLLAEHSARFAEDALTLKGRLLRFVGENAREIRP